MAEPTQEELDAFNAEVQNIIDRALAQGEELTWKEASTRFHNLLQNYARDPEGTHEATHPEDRLDSLETTVANLADRVAHLEDIGGGAVEGG